MRCPPECGVKQYVAIVQNTSGIRFMVFTTGSPRHYWFQMLDGWGCAIAGMAWPVLKRDLQPDIAKALRNGYGNARV